MGIFLSRRVQHIFDEDAVAGGRIADQHMGDRPHQLAVLDDGTARHFCVKYGTKEFCVFLRLLCVFASKRQVFTPINRCP